FLLGKIGPVGRCELLDGVLTLFGLLLDDGGKLFVGDGPHEFHLQVLRRRLQKAQHAQTQAILGLVGGNVVLLDTRCQRHDNSPKMMIEKTRKAERTSRVSTSIAYEIARPGAGKANETNTETLRSSTGGAPPKRTGCTPVKTMERSKPLAFPFP